MSKTTVCKQSARIATLAGLLGVAVGLLAVTCARAETVRLKWVEAGAAARMSPVQPHRIELTDHKPPEVRRVPDDVANPLYGEIAIGPKESVSHIRVLLDAPPGRPSRLFVDANGDGDFTNDPRPVWEMKPYTGNGGKSFTECTGGISVPVQYGRMRLPLHLTLQRYDPSDPARADFKGAILFTPDYAREGDLKLGAKTYHVMLLDAIVGGDFRGLPGGGPTGIFLLIDVNGNGIFDARGETYDIGRPFNIGGVSYALTGVTASAETLDLVKSATRVVEIPPPPDLRVGKIVPGFVKKATDGSTVRFPAAYRGKLVLLYFWATYCGVCAREMPGVAKAYQALHNQGLEIVGVSLDHENASTQLADYTHRVGMPWPEIYDGKWLQSDLAQLYFVQHTPTPILVEGGTGQILAIGADLRGDSLQSTLAAALKRRK
jgi:thiol-disulfide isomerase/thioredoxin